ncbi:hypothetical protein NK553_27060 [Pseudomonas sp. ZM23]|uniref:Ankyrin repeat domain-containing protein n=1 Tax=Pseudomonas triclosanedens TaxID=2961893 RepID=A0ABY6ZQN3_9PSED|nr:hypothetical protein [Pseudomonas triclosanedens]MCP8467618.1 hypothetical protein [Pseudomonas triclosanedens]MCP8473364.1 hypothetical protein [Pseudomonas triclosanedens]MCP8479393.1 hypothetical protein [Pseudomonas triclosanedens]WAI47086.1 hypothetical protein OU419_14985 [Pseudomonas triclosanedens]
MKKTRLALACLPVLLLDLTLARADELSGIRAAAEKGECVIVHEGREEPAVALTASAYDLPSSDKQEVLKLISVFLAHGCSIAQPDSAGMSPLNVSVLTAEPDLLRYLLKAGADPSERISGSRPWANGKNSVELAQALNKVSPSERRKEVLEVLNSN